MIIYSITTALDPTVEHQWVEFMKESQIPAIMATEKFTDFRFVRVIPTEQIDASYNLQLRCKDIETLNNYKAFHEGEMLNNEAKKFQGKLAFFQSTLEHLIDG